MARDYTLNTEAAMQANTGGKRITEPGIYSGKLTAAFYEKNDKGTESVSLMFQSDAGQEIGPLPIYTHNGNGEELPGFNTLNAMMTCMRVRGLSSKSGNVELYDFDQQKTVTKKKDVYPDLIGKPVGLLLRGEEYTNRNNEVKVRMVVAGSYEPSTRLMAGEILAKKTEAHDLDKNAAWLESNPVKRLKGSRPQSSGGSQVTSGAADFADDDIPF
jgi:hypothetical protein